MLVRAFALTALITSLLTMPAASAEEKLVGTYGEARTILAFTVPGEILQKLLPPGWIASPFSTGPSKGANLVVTFMDWLSVQDKDGKPAKTYRNVGLSVPAKPPGIETYVSMTIGGLSSPRDYAPGPYGNSVPAKSTIRRTLSTDDQGVSNAEETWQFEGENGDSVQLQLQFIRGIAERSKLEAKVYSAMKPDFFRIYRIEQAVDVVRSASGSTDRVQRYIFKASGPLLSSLFNGSEQLVSITSMPWYSRQAFLPASRAE